MRVSLGATTIQEQRSGFKPDDKLYLDFAREKGFEPESIVLSDGTKANWLGDANSEVTLVYFHGGGYVLPTFPAHHSWLYSVTKALNEAGHSLSSIMLSYSLAPEATYPTQLRQATSLVSHLITSLNRSPSSLFLAGDSAGGNLLAALLSHALHPHPSVHALPPLSSPFRALILVSPWVSFNTQSPSFTENAESDMFYAGTLRQWAAAYLGQPWADRGDYYSEGGLAPKEWWYGAHRIVEEVLVWGGGGELLIDGIRQFTKTLAAGFEDGVQAERVGGSVETGSSGAEVYRPGEAPVGGDGGAAEGSAEGRKRVEYVETPRAPHDGMIVDLIMGYQEKDRGEGAKAVEAYIKSKL